MQIREIKNKQKFFKKSVKPKAGFLKMSIKLLNFYLEWSKKTEKTETINTSYG